LQDILSDRSAPIQPFLNTATLQALVEGTTPFTLSDSLLMGMERLVQVNAWLKEYHVIIGS
jgi:asparagine synthase (glutamine-hydrolysing)